MKIAYLIAAHNTPNHLPRLISALASPSATFFVHFDRKAAVVDVHNVPGADVHLARDRIDVHWGDFSQVEATLGLLRQALAHGRFDRLVLLSGSDYPIRPVAEIEDFLARHPQRQFINLVRIPNEIARKPLSLVTQRKPRARAGVVVRKVLNRLGVPPPEQDYKRVFGTLEPYGGATWWAITGDLAAYLVRFADEHPQLVDYFRTLVCPDESFFHTIVGNSPYASQVRRCLTWVDWSGGGASPSLITEAHVRRFTSGEEFHPPNVYGEGPAMFARKFPDDSAELVALLRSAKDRLQQRASLEE